MRVAAVCGVNEARVARAGRAPRRDAVHRPRRLPAPPPARHRRHRQPVGRARRRTSRRRRRRGCTCSSRSRSRSRRRASTRWRRRSAAPASRSACSSRIARRRISWRQGAMVDGRRLGRVTLADARVKWYRPPEYYSQSRWRGTWALDGGGALMNQGIHTVDLLLWLLGDVRRVYAKAVTALHAIEVEDTVVAVLEFESGAVGTLEATTAAWPGYNRRVSLSGTRDGGDRAGARRAAGLCASRRSRAPPAERRGARRAASAASPVVADASAHRRVIEDFVDGARQRPPAAGDVREGRRSVALAEAIYESSRSGQPVDVLAPWCAGARASPPGMRRPERNGRACRRTPVSRRTALCVPGGDGRRRRRVAVSFRSGAPRPLPRLQTTQAAPKLAFLTAAQYATVDARDRNDHPGRRSLAGRARRARRRLHRPAPVRVGRADEADVGGGLAALDQASAERFKAPFAKLTGAAAGRAAHRAQPRTSRAKTPLEQFFGPPRTRPSAGTTRRRSASTRSCSTRAISSWPSSSAAPIPSTATSAAASDARRASSGRPCSDPCRTDSSTQDAAGRRRAAGSVAQGGGLHQARVGRTTTSSSSGPARPAAWPPFSSRRRASRCCCSRPGACSIRRGNTGRWSGRIASDAPRPRCRPTSSRSALPNTT